MNKSNIKIISLMNLFFFCIFAALIITQINLFNNELNNKQPSKEALNLGLSDGPQEPGNLSAYQKFQEFWTDVYAQDALNWSYLNWRNYIILQIFGNTEDNLNNTIKNDPLFENNIDVFTIYVMGMYNESLSEEDITNLKSQLIHNTVHIGDISFLKHDDTQLKISINVEVESSPSMWYVADHIDIYLKSEKPSGKWYNESATHYDQVYYISNLELSDPINTDGNYENYIVGPIVIDTNTNEENVSLIVKVEYFLNFVMDDYVEKIELFNLIDDDISPPEISYTYTGDYTDENPGELVVNASDISGLSLDPSGTYLVPNTLGSHKFVFIARDADTDRPDDMLNTTITVWITIIDDDDEGPIIKNVNITNNCVYDYYDFIIVDILTEDKSGISELFIEFNGTRFYDDNGDSQIFIENLRIPGILYDFTVVAIDADNDREGDQKMTQVVSSFEVFDDDTTPPTIYLYYDDFSYQISICDNDGIIDSKATGEFYLIDEEGIILQSGIISQEDFNYTISIPLKPGNYNLEVYTTNNDNEGDSDQEFNNVIFHIYVDLEGCFSYVDYLLEELKVYVDINLYSIIADNIRFKLCLAQEYLMDALELVKAGDLNYGLFNEFVVQALIEFVEFETEFYNKFNFITEEIRNETILALRQIRNFVVLLIGTSVDYVKDINCGFDIASIEVELLNLADFVQEELGDCDSKYLERLIKLSALQLELAIIKLSRDINPDSTLSLAQRFIDRARQEVNKLLESGKISENVACSLLNTLDYCYFEIDKIIYNNDQN
ncbi:MAG: hypothetical protein ACFE8G_11450 [Candidatus Hermodarchaeota archaeon]